jgi:hypothetical protein
LGEQYRSWSSSLWNFLYSPLPLPSWAQIFFSTRYSQTSSACLIPSISATKFHTHTKQQAKGKTITLSSCLIRKRHSA